jgi:hypothetical protein
MPGRDTQRDRSQFRRADAYARRLREQSHAARSAACAGFRCRGCGGQEKEEELFPPCKKRKKGECKKRLPDRSACTAGTCRGGNCIPPSPSGWPDCAGKVCGSNGCGGSCGWCDPSIFRWARHGDAVDARASDSRRGGTQIPVHLRIFEGASQHSVPRLATTVITITGTSMISPAFAEAAKRMNRGL